MKLSYWLVFMCCFAANVFAQDNSSIPSTSIPRTDTSSPNNQGSTPQYSISKPFEPTRFKVPPKYAPISMDKPMQVKPELSDLNPGLQYQKKLNQSLRNLEGSSNLDSEAFRRDQYFGQFITESETLKINYRDFGAVDGDKIRVWVAGKVVAEVIVLTGSTDKFYIGLVLGENIVEIEAINEGQLSPNTGEFSLVDGDNKLLISDQLYVATGFKAQFNINRIPKNSKVLK